MSPHPRLSRRDFLRLLLRAALGLLPPALLAPWYARRVEPAWVRVALYRVALPGLHPDLTGLRLVHLTDLHADGVFARPWRLQQWVRLALQQRPHVLILTGDYITHAARWARDLQVGLHGLRAPLGVFAVLGNHDYWTSARAVQQALEVHGVVVLRNQVVTIQQGQGRLHLAGLDDVMEARHDLERTLAARPATDPALLLVHEPDIADQVATTGRFALQISGHSHGGQVCLPGLGPLVLPPYGQRYPRGWYRVGDMLLYTSPGLGMVPPRVRWFCPPELTVFVLEPSPTAQPLVRTRGVMWGKGLR